MGGVKKWAWPKWAESESGRGLMVSVRARKREKETLAQGARKLGAWLMTGKVSEKGGVAYDR